MVEITFEDDRSVDDIKELFGTVDTGQLNRVLTYNHKEETYKIDLPELLNILREHNIYDQSATANEIEILQTIETTTEKNEWITIGDLQDEHDDLDQSTIYRHLKHFVDEDLVERIGGERSGTYRYIGP